MEMKKKYINRKKWSRVLDSKFGFCKLNEKNITGVAGLLFIKQVKEPLIKKYKEDLELKIVDNNYYWLQIGIENSNYWITAMYDDKKNLIQYYIDITDRNIIKNSDSYFIDLFLDVVITINEEGIILDEDELETALKQNVINKKQYEGAYLKAKEILENIQQKKKELDTICNKYFDILIKKIENVIELKM